ncbi:MAG: DEAD/DEAH box helicase [Myxococcaceae bacterium]|nr:DEAD/DEAH box helicase [Myxococcaceae bacterium]
MSTAPLPEAPSERPQEYLADVGFTDLNLSHELMKAISERGYTHPTPVQAKAFGPVMAGKDIIVRSKTGTGKTAAFGIPLLEKIPIGDRGVRALIMCPTRELAMQVAAELEALAKYRNIAVIAIYGGASMKQQEDALAGGASIVVGTPGRVYDHIRRKNLKLDGCRFAVLDEADEMLNQGFYEEVTRILDCTPDDRQVLLFSATVPDDIQRLIAKYTTDAETLLLSGDVYTVEHIHHIRYDISDAYPKPRNLIYMLELHEPDSAIVFCNTRTDTELVTAVLNRNGFDAELLNGDLPQKERERVMAKIKRGEVAFMVATDLAARGIDISDLSHVVNYSLPEDPAVYLHRVGRTGRIGKKGTALNLISGKELATFTALEKKYGIKFDKRDMPSPEKALERWTERHVAELKDAAAGSIYEGYLPLAAAIKQRPDADALIASMLRSFFAYRRRDKARSGGTAEAPAGAAAAPEPRREKFDRKDRDRDRERGPRRERDRDRDRDRGPRYEKRTDDATAIIAAPAGLQDRPAPRSGASDREMFEAMQAGRPIPLTVEATSSDAPTDPAGSAAVEKRARRPRRAEGAGAVRAAEPGQVRLWVNLGKASGLDAAGVTSALEAAGAPAGKVQHVELLGAFSYVFVPEGDAAGFEGATGKKHGERSIKIERAKK